MPIRFRDIFKRGEDEEGSAPSERPTESIRPARSPKASERTEVVRRTTRRSEAPETPPKPPGPGRPESGSRRPAPRERKTRISREVSDALEEILSEEGLLGGEDREGEDWEITLDEVLEKYSDEGVHEPSTESLSEDQVESLRDILAEEEGRSEEGGLR